MAPLSLRPASKRPRATGYSLLRRLGRGGMADVYLAEQDESDGRLVALKFVKESARSDPGMAAMLRREAMSASRGEHPNKVRVLDACPEQGFIAMEYVEGPTLRQLLQRSYANGGPGLSPALTIVRGLCRALHAVHTAQTPNGEPLGLVHRDISPSNVLLRSDGRVKLSDFGIAKTTAQPVTTVGGSVKGKFGYMAPEQYRCEPVDRRTDIYSLGVVMTELLTGRHPLPGKNEFKIMGRVLRGDVPTPRSLDPSCPKELDEIVRRAIAPEREDRFDSALELGAAIDTFVRRFGVKASTDDVRRCLRRYFPRPQRLSPFAPLAVARPVRQELLADWRHEDTTTKVVKTRAYEAVTVVLQRLRKVGANSRPSAAAFLATWLGCAIVGLGAATVSHLRSPDTSSAHQKPSNETTTDEPASASAKPDTDRARATPAVSDERTDERRLPIRTRPRR